MIVKGASHSGRPLSQLIQTVTEEDGRQEYDIPPAKPGGPSPTLAIPHGHTQGLCVLEGGTLPP